MTPEKLAALADKIDPAISTNTVSADDAGTLYQFAKVDDLAAASDALRTLSQGYAAGVEAMVGDVSV